MQGESGYISTFILSIKRGLGECGLGKGEPDDYFLTLQWKY